MDSDVLNPSDDKKSHADVQPPMGEVGIGKEDDDDLNALLSPQKGQTSKRQTNSRRKVQWNDRNGNKLVEVLEFQPRENYMWTKSFDKYDTSDSDAEEDSDSCFCTVM